VDLLTTMTRTAGASNPAAGGRDLGSLSSVKVDQWRYGGSPGATNRNWAAAES
jgi:hypothetical protein